ncbi:MAG: SRPBCC family protein [Actinomycetota bacterium]|nr:SRPBCC family protein [Actinomycetota bacterium]
MTEYEQTHRMPAPRERVFEVASDLDALGGWLPAGMQPHHAGPEVVAVHTETAGEVDGLFRAQGDQMRLEWGDRGRDEYSGWLQLYALDDRQSEANLHLSFRGRHPLAAHGRADEDVPRLLGEALERLAELVAQRAGAAR